MSISAVVLAYNDADTIRECLDSLAWTDEIVCVLSPSTDGTDEIVRQLADTVVTVPPAGPGEPFDHFRAEGFEAAANDWVVPLDADEVMPPALADRLRNLAASSCGDVVWGPRKTYFRDRWLDGGYYWPAWTPWLINRSKVTVTPDVHYFYSFDQDTEHLYTPPEEQYAVRHQIAESYRGAFQTARRHAKIRAKQESFSPRKLCAFVYTFWKFYIDSQSYKDGVPGLILSLIHAWYRMETVLRSLIHPQNLPSNQ